MENYLFIFSLTSGTHDGARIFVTSVLAPLQTNPVVGSRINMGKKEMALGRLIQNGDRN